MKRRAFLQLLSALVAAPAAALAPCNPSKPGPVGWVDGGLETGISFLHRRCPRCGHWMERSELGRWWHCDYCCHMISDLNDYDRPMTASEVIARRRPEFFEEPEPLSVADLMSLREYLSRLRGPEARRASLLYAEACDRILAGRFGDKGLG